MKVERVPSDITDITVTDNESEDGSEITITLHRPEHTDVDSEISDNENVLPDVEVPNDNREQNAVMENAICPICKHEVKENDQGLQCDLCNLWYHSNCCGMSENCFNTLQQEGDKVAWSCPAHAPKHQLGLRSRSRLDKIAQNIQEETRRGKPPGFKVHQSP